MTNVYGDFGCKATAQLGVTPIVTNLEELLPEAYAAAEAEIQKEKRRLWWEKNRILILGLGAGLAVTYTLKRKRR